VVDEVGDDVPSVSVGEAVFGLDAPGVRPKPTPTSRRATLAARSSSPSEPISHKLKENHP